MPAPSRAPPTVAYDIKAILRPLPGKHYLGFTCPACAKPIAMLRDDGHKAGANGLKPSALQVKCPSCDALSSFNTSELKPFEV